MKREAIGHPKMQRLCRRLDIPLWQGVGIMESLWHFTAKYAPRGDVGRHSDEDIAVGIDYRGDEHKLVEALVRAGWVDTDEVGRLVVHDWWDHADDSVHMKLARSQQFFVCGRAPKLSRLGSKERDLCAQFYSSCAQQAHGVRTESAQNVILCTPPRLSPALAPPLVQECSSGDERGFALVAPVNGTKKQKAKPIAERSHPDFDRFWKIRWRSSGKVSAQRAFRKQASSADRVDQIIDAEKSQRAEYMERPKDKRPHMATWLNEQRFLDEAEPEQLANPVAPKVEVFDIKAAMLAARKEQSK